MYVPGKIPHRVAFLCECAQMVFPLKGISMEVGNISQIAADLRR